MKLSLYIFLTCVINAIIGKDKIFMPNTNYGNVANWQERHAPCDMSHIVLPSKAPRIFIEGSSSAYRISEMNLPMDGELLLGNSVTLTTSVASEDSDHCEVIMAHYIKVVPDFWYNPINWCQALTPESPCLVKPQVEASLVPSSADSAVFMKKNSFYTGFKSSEGKVVVKEIIVRGVRYRSTAAFRKRMTRTRKRKTVEFENVDNKYPPLVELKGRKCDNNRCAINSNLARMTQICSYVTCAPISCKSAVRPSGSCCPLCGKVFTVTVVEGSYTFEKWFEDQMEYHYKKTVIFNVLSVKYSKFEVVLSSVDRSSDLSDSLASEIVNKILLKKMQLGVEYIRGTSWTFEEHSRSSHSSALLVILVILVISVVLGTLFAMRRRIPFLPAISGAISSHIPSLTTITLPTKNLNFFLAKVSSSRLNEEVETVTSSGSMFQTISGAIEVIELPEKVADLSFDNPMFHSELGFEDSPQ